MARPALGQVAAAYRDLATQWSALAGAAIAEGVPGLRKAAESTRRVDDIVALRGDAGRR